MRFKSHLGCLWCESVLGLDALRSAAIICLCSSTTALAQKPNQSYDYTALMEQICRQYAYAQTGMPADLMFNQCMSERHCRVASGSSAYRCELPGPMTWHGGGY